MKQGKLYVISLSNVRKLPENTEIVKLLVTRQKKKINGIVWYPCLAPSTELFRTYINKWKGGKVENWWELYTEAFTKEMVREPMLSALKLAYKSLRQGANIAFICFCNTNKRKCHRYLLGDVIKALDIEVIDIK